VVVPVTIWHPETVLLTLDDPILNPFKDYFASCDPDVQVYQSTTVSAEGTYSAV
jgi:hypothetical protein